MRSKTVVLGWAKIEIPARTHTADRQIEQKTIKTTLLHIQNTFAVVSRWWPMNACVLHSFHAIFFVLVSSAPFIALGIFRITTIEIHTNNEYRERGKSKQFCYPHVIGFEFCKCSLNETNECENLFCFVFFLFISGKTMDLTPVHCSITIESSWYGAREVMERSIRIGNTLEILLLTIGWWLKKKKELLWFNEWVHRFASDVRRLLINQLYESYAC